MSKFSEWNQSLQFKLASSVPAPLYSALMPYLQDTRGLARQLLKPYLSVTHWEGHNQAGSLKVNYIGPGQAQSFLKNVLFTDPPSEKILGTVPVWRINRLKSLPVSDLTVIEANRHLVERLPQRQAFVSPAFLEMALDVQGSWEEVQQRFRKSVKNERSRVNKYGYEYRVSHDDADFEMFYTDMHLPTSENRHGDRSVPTPKNEAYHYFKHGALFLTLRDGKPVAGGICHIEQGLVNFILMGVLDGDPTLMKEGAVGAMNYLRVQWANKSGYKAISFGYCRPFMANLFHNKRKWGTAAVVPPNQPDRLWIKLERHTPAVSKFMTDTPFVIFDQQQELYGLITVDDSEALNIDSTSLRKQYETPGLQGLIVQTSNNFFKPKAGAANFEQAVSVSFQPTSNLGTR